MAAAGPRGTCLGGRPSRQLPIPKASPCSPRIRLRELSRFGDPSPGRALLKQPLYFPAPAAHPVGFWTCPAPKGVAAGTACLSFRHSPSSHPKGYSPWEPSNPASASEIFPRQTVALFDGTLDGVLGAGVLASHLHGGSKPRVEIRIRTAEFGGGLDFLDQFIDELPFHFVGVDFPPFLFPLGSHGQGVIGVRQRQSNRDLLQRLNCLFWQVSFWLSRSRICDELRR